MLKIVTDNIDKSIQAIQRRTAYVDRPEADVVRDILKNIYNQGSAALLDYVSKFEFPANSFEDIKVSEKEMQEAYEASADELKELLSKAIDNIRAYHEKFLLQSWQGNVYDKSSYGMKVTPINRAGVYVPGGTAAYPTSVLMNVIPAQVAGVKEIVVASPAGKDGKLSQAVLAAAYMLDVKEVYAMGGAQAVAALAYGTEDIKKVDKIVGPGNIYVTLAKKEVFGVVGIDKLAGPSDVCVVADDSARADFIAADLLAQAEHDVLASAVLITDSRAFADKVRSEVNKQFNLLPRQEILKKALEDNSVIIVKENATIEELASIADQIAPEHLEIFHKEEDALLKLVNNAGAFFIGNHSAEVLGDYMLGPNHVLPTGGNAKFSSPLSAVEFQKYSTVVKMAKEDYSEIGEDTAIFADIEQLPAHAAAARIRLV